MPYYLKGEFVTKEEGNARAAVLSPLPLKILQVEKDVEALKPMPARIQILEDKAAIQTSINVRRDAQIDATVTASNNLAVQLGIAISKIDNANQRLERIEKNQDGRRNQ